MAGMDWMAIGNSSGQLTQAGIQLAIAADKKRQAKGIDDTYRIPDEIYQNLSQAHQQAMQGMSAQEANNFAKNVYNQQTYANQGATDRKAGIIGLGQTNEAANNAFLQYAGMNSAVQRANQDKLYGMRSNLADYKDMQWVHNIDQPYQKLMGQHDAYLTASGRQASQAMASAAGSNADSGGLGKNDAIGNQGLQKSMSAPYSGNPYAKNAGTYTAPNENMFNRSPYGDNPYGGNAGSFQDPNAGAGMFNRGGTKW